jgi:hypothetical protein
MAIHYNIDDDKIISLDEYQDFVFSNVNHEDAESIQESAYMLKRLSNNRTFLTDFVTEQLKQYKIFKGGDFYTPNVFHLRGNERFLIRANVWKPAAIDEQRRKLEDPLFSFNMPHDHNFNFLTAGYFGPGYETEIYEYNRSKVKGEIGEKVEIRFLEKVNLNQGELIFFRAGKDIHTQLHPKSMSISLNLLVYHDGVFLNDQFYFDTKKSEITGYSGSNNCGRVNLFEISEQLYDNNLIDVMETISKKHPNERTRNAAKKSLNSILRNAV